MMNKIYFYFWAYMISLVGTFFAICLFFGVIMGILMFVTWSLPVASPFTWVVFRILLSLSILLSAVFMFTPNAKEWVNKCCKEYEGR